MKLKHLCQTRKQETLEPGSVRNSTIQTLTQVRNRLRGEHQVSDALFASVKSLTTAGIRRLGWLPSSAHGEVVLTTVFHSRLFIQYISHCHSGGRPTSDSGTQHHSHCHSGDQSTSIPAIPSRCFCESSTRELSRADHCSDRRWMYRDNVTFDLPSQNTKNTETLHRSYASGSAIDQETLHRQYTSVTTIDQVIACDSTSATFHKQE